MQLLRNAHSQPRPPSSYCRSTQCVESGCFSMAPMGFSIWMTTCGLSYCAHCSSHSCRAYAMSACIASGDLPRKAFFSRR